MRRIGRERRIWPPRARQAALGRAHASRAKAYARCRGGSARHRRPDSSVGAGVWCRGEGGEAPPLRMTGVTRNSRGPIRIVLPYSVTHALTHSRTRVIVRAIVGLLAGPPLPPRVILSERALPLKHALNWTRAKDLAAARTAGRPRTGACLESEGLRQVP